ncbi:hypothetical protein JKP88DRAFT_82315 [Tribonema minus]|uniref:Secreted protein n=1 Tax=Tribonema minus TaxID=303371 RepID=A0A835YQA7_9STRA|nr:hypothetical protein JKP88DRAFT_82315 [Tribonema minus]
MSALLSLLFACYLVSRVRCTCTRPSTCMSCICVMTTVCTSSCSIDTRSNAFLSAASLKLEVVHPSHHGAPPSPSGLFSVPTSDKRTYRSRQRACE